MKTNIVLCLTALAALSACGSMAQLSQAPTQRFRDGIYYKPQTEETVAAPVADSEVANLVEETKGSQIFLHSGQNDTLFIPENKAVSFKFNPQEGNTTVTVFDTPDYYWNYSWAYRPWYLSSWWDPWYGSSWYWSSPWYYSSIYWDSWYWGSPWYYGPSWYYHHPWHYGWGYSSLYWSPWFHDPWFYGDYGWFVYDSTLTFIEPMY